MMNHPFDPAVRPKIGRVTKKKLSRRRRPPVTRRRVEKVSCTPKNVSFLQLPDDVFIKIFNLLSDEQLPSEQHSTLQLNRISMNQESLPLAPTCNEDVISLALSNRNLMEIACRCFPITRIHAIYDIHLSLNVSSRDDDYLSPCKIFPLLSTHSTSIKSLELPDIPNMSKAKDIIFHALRRCSLHHLRFTIDNSASETFFIKLSQSTSLRSLDVKNPNSSFLNTMARKLRTLDSLTLRKVQFADLNTLKDILGDRALNVQTESEVLPLKRLELDIDVNYKYVKDEASLQSHCRDIDYLQTFISRMRYLTKTKLSQLELFLLYSREHKSALIQCCHRLVLARKKDIPFFLPCTTFQTRLSWGKSTIISTSSINQAVIFATDRPSYEEFKLACEASIELAVEKISFAIFISWDQDDAYHFINEMRSEYLEVLQQVAKRGNLTFLCLSSYRHHRRNILSCPPLVKEFEFLSFFISSTPSITTVEIHFQLIFDMGKQVNQDNHFIQQFYKSLENIRSLKISYIAHEISTVELRTLFCDGLINLLDAVSRHNGKLDYLIMKGDLVGCEAKRFFEGTKLRPRVSDDLDIYSSLRRLYWTLLDAMKRHKWTDFSSLLALINAWGIGPSHSSSSSDSSPSRDASL